MKRNLAVPILALALLSMGSNCAKTSTPGTPDPKAALRKTAESLATIAKYTKLVTDTAISLNASKLVGDDETRKILDVIEKVALAGKEATSVTRALDALDDNDRTKLVQILKPVFKAFHDGLDSGLFNVKNPESAAKLNGYVSAIEVAVSSIELILSISR